MPAAPLAPKFATRATRWFVAVAVASLAASLWLLMSPGEPSSRSTVDADGYSRSALGHRGVVTWLREMGETVAQSRRARGPGRCGLLVLAEPKPMERPDTARMRPILAAAKARLLVLPKRRGERDLREPTWVERVYVRPLAEVNRLCVEVGECAEVHAPTVLRSDRTTAWRSPPGWPQPELVGAAQLLDADDAELTPIVACDEGVLLGRVGDLHVLADPDLIENHGLARGANAELVLAMLRRIKGDGAIVFDETLHGHDLSPSIWHAAGQSPHLLVTAHLLLLLALVAWIARGRFGPVLREVPPIGAGKAFLIDNVASLLRSTSAATPSLRRYARQRVRRAAEMLRAPRGLDDTACQRFVLARLPAPARERLEELLARTKTVVAESDAVAVARDLRLLTEGTLHARS